MPQVDGGYYGDPDTGCQAFHLCADTGAEQLSKVVLSAAETRVIRLTFLSQFSFLCPNGTLFQQEYLVCDWWFNVDCSVTRAR